MRAKFPIDLQEELLGKTHWGEREFEALCLGVPPRKYCDCDEIAPQAEREAARREITLAIRCGRIFAKETGEGNSLYGGQWNLDPVSAVRWAMCSGMFPKFPNWLKAGKLEEIYRRQDAERLRAGRYTLLQAADEIANHTGEQQSAILDILKNAVTRGALAVHLPGSKAPYQSDTVREFYEEAYWDDLNKCLEEFLPRHAWRLPDPQHQNDCANPGEIAEPGGDKTQVAVSGIGRKEILSVDWPLINAFGEDSLGRALSDVPNWLKPARTAKGAPGRGSALWNPAILAICLLEKGYARETALTNLMRRSFPECLDQWNQSLSEKQ